MPCKPVAGRRSNRNTRSPPGEDRKRNIGRMECARCRLRVFPLDRRKGLTASSAGSPQRGEGGGEGRTYREILAPYPPCPRNGAGAGPVRGKLVPPFERQSSGSARLVSPASAAIQFWNA